MTSETELAFAHPEARAKATADRPLDRLSLRNHIVDVEIGAFQSERDVTQRLSFNVVVEIAPLPVDLDDDVDRILSYDTLAESIAAELAAERLNLLETLCDRVALRILQEPQARRVFVRIEKLDRGPGALGVEIVRSKEGVVTDAPVDVVAAPNPRIAYLTEVALKSPHVSHWIDQMAAMEAPLVVCVPPAPTKDRDGMSDGPRRRAALVSVELAAWQLNNREPRCVVVASRTELDWALKNRQISVWAPAKIVLDAPEGSDVDAEDGWALAKWFAEHFAACEVLAFAGDADVANWTSATPLRAVTLEQAEI
ncbi:dihydroneopterin aldolase [Epibacterium ulvae]|uniref:dihydroneopterin aldolase n=1 Tax=Epibacterium ulvae TaxID=1156985 RepID=UPI001BFC5ED8|nr:dihydroneopterin aldolase [Epibacterium ulvae]MBT8153124.1 dihydroneopterin aldolase [Epibacterium ulvae]